MNIQKHHTASKMGIVFAVALVTGNMIGSGIFLLPAALAHYGAISVFGWVLTASGAILLALVFSKLSRLYPLVGGPYAYARLAFGDFIGFLVAWGYWIGVWSGNAAIAIAGVGYLSVFIPHLHEPFYSSAMAIAIVWLVTGINMFNLKYSGLLQVITTILKILPLLLVGTLGWLFVDFHRYSPFNLTSQTSFSAITAIATLTLWAFIGIESATIPASYIEQPEKNIPRATLIGTIITTIIYISSTMAVIGLLPAHLLTSSSAPFADASRPILGNIAYYLFAASGAIACLGTLNGWILIQGQIPMAAAQDHLFPAIFRQVNLAHLPAKGIFIGSVLITLLIVMNFTKTLVVLYTFTILLATLTTLIPYLFCALALLLLLKRKHYQKHINKKNLNLTFLLSMCAFLYTLWVIYGAGEKVVFYGFLLLLLGGPVYTWQKWHKSKEEK